MPIRTKAMSVAPAVAGPALLPLGPNRVHPPFYLDRHATLVGSRHRADISLESDEVSRSHAVLVNMGGRVVVRDLGSRTHTYVNGQEIHEAELADGDHLSIGQFVLRFYAQIAPEGGGPTGGASAGAAGTKATLSGESLPQAVALDDGLCVIGSRPGVDLLLTGKAVSFAHAIIFPNAGRHLIRDLGSRTGTFVNEVEVEGDTLLRPGSVIRVGSHLMRYAAAAVAVPASVAAPVAVVAPAARPAPTPPPAPTAEEEPLPAPLDVGVEVPEVPTEDTAAGEPEPVVEAATPAAPTPHVRQPEAPAGPQPVVEESPDEPLSAEQLELPQWDEPALEEPAADEPPPGVDAGLEPPPVAAPAVEVPEMEEPTPERPPEEPASAVASDEALPPAPEPEPRTDEDAYEPVESAAGEAETVITVQPDDLIEIDTFEGEELAEIDAVVEALSEPAAEAPPEEPTLATTSAEVAPAEPELRDDAPEDVTTVHVTPSEDEPTDYGRVLDQYARPAPQEPAPAVWSDEPLDGPADAPTPPPPVAVVAVQEPVAPPAALPVAPAAPPAPEVAPAVLEAAPPVARPAPRVTPSVPRATPSVPREVPSAPRPQAVAAQPAFAAGVVTKPKARPAAAAPPRIEAAAKWKEASAPAPLQSSPPAHAASTFAPAPASAPAPAHSHAHAPAPAPRNWGVLAAAITLSEEPPSDAPAPAGGGARHERRVSAWAKWLAAGVLLAAGAYTVIATGAYAAAFRFVH